MTTNKTNEHKLLEFSKLLKDKELLNTVKNLGFKKATIVQTLSIPPTLKGKDLIVQASTGSGKTLAFGLPLIEIMNQVAKKEKVNYTFGVVITPTRELAIQIADVLSSLKEDLKPVLIIGGMPYGKQESGLKNDPRIVVGTPGRMLDFLKKKTLDVRDCEVFVLDEADEMFSMGLSQDVESIIKEIPKHTQGLFVSATVSPRVVMLGEKYLKEPIQITASTFEEKPPQIEHLYTNVGGQVTDKPLAVCSILDTVKPESAIIFCNRKSETELIEVYLRRKNYDALKINSDLNQNQRTKIMSKIRAGDLKYLIATDIAARGIDIPKIDLVINVGVPDAFDSYVHRTGRTGRAGREGKAITIVGALDFLSFKTLRNKLDVDFEEFKLPQKVISE